MILGWSKREGHDLLSSSWIRVSKVLTPEVGKLIREQRLRKERSQSSKWNCRRRWWGRGRAVELGSLCRDLGLCLEVKAKRRPPGLHLPIATPFIHTTFQDSPIYRNASNHHSERIIAGMIIFWTRYTREWEIYIAVMIINASKTSSYNCPLAVVIHTDYSCVKLPITVFVWTSHGFPVCCSVNEIGRPASYRST